MSEQDEGLPPVLEALENPYSFVIGTYVVGHPLRVGWAS